MKHLGMRHNPAGRFTTTISLTLRRDVISLEIAIETSPNPVPAFARTGTLTSGGIAIEVDRSTAGCDVLNSMTPLIINFTPTGMVATKELNSYTPISVSEIVEDVHQAYELGITIVHLHARDETSGQPTYRRDIYARILEGVQKHCPDLVTCVSLSGRNFREFAQRSEAIELRPDMGSLTLSSMNFAQHASLNEPDMIRKLAEKMTEYSVKPELEVFDLGMINYGLHLIGRNVLTPPYYFNLICGNIAGLQVDASSIGAALSQLPKDCHWALGGIGRTQLSANGLAIALGGGVRVGLEDNLFFDPKRQMPASNLDLLIRIHQLAEIFNRPILRPREFGQLGFYNASRRLSETLSNTRP